METCLDDISHPPTFLPHNVLTHVPFFSLFLLRRFFLVWIQFLCPSLVFLLLNWIMWFSSLLITIKIRRFYSLIIEMSFHPLPARAVAVAEPSESIEFHGDERTMENSILDFRYFSTLFLYTSVLALGFFSNFKFSSVFSSFVFAAGVHAKWNDSNSIMAILFNEWPEWFVIR